MSEPLQEMRARLLWALDGEGRMVRVNEPHGQAAPLLWVGRSGEGTTVRTRQGLPATLEDEVQGVLAEAQAWSPGEALDAETIERLRAALEGVGPVGAVRQGPVFRFPLPLFAVGAMQLYPPHAALLHPTLAPWAPELRERAPAFVVLRDGQAVAICACARVSREAAEAGVETAPEFRGQGYAVLAAQAWAAAIAESGRIPFYSTTWENTASRAVAEKLALEEVGEDVWFSP